MEHEDVWAYSDTASTIKFNSWNDHEPNNANQNEDCVLLDRNAGWLDINCNGKRRFICEYAGKNHMLICTV